MRSEPVLVIGATGYVGGRLVPRLLDAGYRVRAMGRSLAKLSSRPWATHPRVELVKGDVLDEESLGKAVQGCWAAFYLVHSMVSASRDFAEKDRRSAMNMVLTAARGGLERIIYLGGLGCTDDPKLSKHLRSRHEVARILHEGPVPATILRAAMILGSGSASFEMLRYLVDRLPLMLTPTWVHTPVQPISIRNVLNYLHGCLERDETVGQTFDIGGPEVLTYESLIEMYAEVAGLPKRIIIPLPWITPRLSSLWIHLITPIPASLAGPLTEGLLNKVVCADNRIVSIIPQKLMDCRSTIRRALEKIEQQKVEACWTDAGTLLPPEWVYCGDAEYAGGTIQECGYRIVVGAEPEEIWEHIVRIGGKTGWYYGGPLWRIRGWLDRVLGGAGLRRGRRHPVQLYVGDALDFWRVMELAPPYRLLLLSEMKLPGEAVLEFKITPRRKGESELQQLSRFMPRGVTGILYWNSLYIFHQLLFRGMLRTIARAVGAPLIRGPERFTPRMSLTCRIGSHKD